MKKTKKTISSQLWHSQFYNDILNTELEKHIGAFCHLWNEWQSKTKSNKQNNRWRMQLQDLAQLTHNYKSHLEIGDCVSVTTQDPIQLEHQKKIPHILKQFMPWRKGPFNILGTHIDTEWRSDFKWQRIINHIDDLNNKRVLDIGCGSGYHLFRMHQNGAQQVIGVDPTDLFFYQFQIFKHFCPDWNLHYLPFGIEHLPPSHYFDTVFSMGVLYHRPDPLKFLQELKQQLRGKGQLVLETLVVDGDQNTVLIPKDRYAKMRNVWFIPSIEALKLWLTRLGFEDVKCINVDTTSIEEQRKTEWIEGQSLADFLDPSDNSLTIEGYPAPKRATITARIK